MTETKKNMGLSTKQILTLMQLKRCGRKTALKVARFANGMNLLSAADMADFLRDLRECGRVKRLADYSISDIKNAERIAEEIIAKSTEAGIGVISYYDPQYPNALRNLVTEKGTTDPPAVLYYKGELSVTELPSIAIIGTRNATAEGICAGEIFGQKFAENGFNVVSGLALGCDSAGHCGALNGNGATTAILAHGLDSVYPVENSNLAQSILDSGGLLLSEFPIGEQVRPNRLIDRDRLQAGLAKATLVIQTGEYGGTMHAANATLAAGKPLFVVKYKSDRLMFSDNVRGNIYLADRGAILFTAENAESIIESLLAEAHHATQVKTATQIYKQMEFAF